MSKVTAVIDIGSNSARMAIFRRTSRYGFSLIFESKSKVRISEGCYENNGILQQDAMNRAIYALKDFVKLARNYNAKKLFCVATSAVRDAPNKNEFISLVKKEIKIQVKVINGEKEAFFGAVACCNLLHKKDGITIDIGGGSTECALIENGKIKELISLNIGTIRLKELFFDSKNDIANAQEFIQNEIDKIPQTFISSNVFGIGGTIRALSKLIMKKEKYKIDSIHGYEFDPRQYRDFFQSIYSSDLKKLKDFNIPQEREDNIRGGALIFSMLLERFRSKLVVTSGVGVREGVFLSDLLRRQNYVFPNGINPSYRSILDRFIIEEKAQNSVKKNSLKLFNELSCVHNIDSKYLFHLENAAGLTKVGNYLGYYSSHEHGAYFLLNALSYGYSHIDRAIISLLVKYSSKKIPKDDEIVHLDKYMPDIRILQWLSFILSVAEVLSLVDCVFNFEFRDNTLYISSKDTFYVIKEKVSSLHKPDSINIEFVRL